MRQPQATKYKIGLGYSLTTVVSKERWGGQNSSRLIKMNWSGEFSFTRSYVNIQTHMLFYNNYRVTNWYSSVLNAVI